MADPTPTHRQPTCGSTARGLGGDASAEDDLWPGNMRSSLDRRLPRSLTTDDELFVMRRAAWRAQGIAVIRPADIRDDWLRQAIVNEADRLYGRRENG